MKRFLILFLVCSSLHAAAQNRLTLIDENELPSLVERLMDKRDSVNNDGYKVRRITAHINLEFAGSANAYFSADEFD